MGLIVFRPDTHREHDCAATSEESHISWLHVFHLESPSDRVEAEILHTKAVTSLNETGREPKPAPLHGASVRYTAKRSCSLIQIAQCPMNFVRFPQWSRKWVLLAL